MIFIEKGEVPKWNMPVDSVYRHADIDIDRYKQEYLGEWGHSIAMQRQQREQLKAMNDMFGGNYVSDR